MFLHKCPFGPLETNTIILGCSKTKKAAVIDPAYLSSGWVLQYAEKHGLAIEKILLTHSHWDHFADAYHLKQKTGAELFVHSLDAKNLGSPGSDKIPLFVAVHSVKYDHLLKEGELIEIGSISLEVIHTPGHSPGSVCFYSKAEHLLISGDTLFRGSMGNLHLPTGEPSLMWPSLKKLATLPPETRVIPGHGAETTIGAESWLSRAEEFFSE